MLPRRALLAAPALLLPSLVRAQPAWPTHPLKLVVPFAPAGATDAVARVMAQALGDRLGQPVVVENRSGASGNLGTEVVARARPDGLTMLYATATSAINLTVFPNLPFNLRRDFTPVVLIAVLPGVVVVPAASPIRSIADLIAAAKADPGGLHYGSGGIGSSIHLSSEMFDLMAGTRMTHVPYRGSAPAILDMYAGRLQLMFDNLPSSIEHIHAGRLRAIAVTTPQPLPTLPGVPTVAASLPGYEATSWHGLLLPRGSPAEAVARLNTATNAALADTSVRDNVLAQGALPAGGTPAQMAAHLEAEIARWAPVVRAAGVTPG